jgi:tetratricopeptide (TPR) repeat protein
MPESDVSYCLNWRGSDVVKHAAMVMAICALAVWVAPLGAQEVPGCGNLRNGYGPFDYRNPADRRDKLPIVEAYHFNADVESLRRSTTGNLLADINYTLRAFPNHHRALRAIARYSLEGGRFQADDPIPSAECYFDRAIAFQPTDEAVHAIYGTFLTKRGDMQRAGREYEEALRLKPESAEINYVAGLYFLEVGNLDRARSLAKIAYDEGYPLPGLQNRLAAAEAAAGRKK